MRLLSHHVVVDVVAGGLGPADVRGRRGVLPSWGRPSIHELAAVETAIGARR